MSSDKTRVFRQEFPGVSKDNFWIFPEGLVKIVFSEGLDKASTLDARIYAQLFVDSTYSRANFAINSLLNSLFVTYSG